MNGIASRIRFGVVAACGTLCLPPGSAAQTPAEIGSAADRTLLVGGRWLDVENGQLLPNYGLLVTNGRIARIYADRERLPEPGAEDRVVELEPGHVILPGMFDLHAHYAIDLFGEGRVDEVEAYPLLFLANGVTATFPAGEMDPERMRRLRVEIDRGDRVGPRLLNSGPYFGTWRRGWDNGRMTADSIAAEVDHWAERGARGFKAKGIREDHLEALIAAAHRHGLTVTGHLDSGYGGSVNPSRAIDLGIDRVEHFLGGDLTPATRSAYASLREFEDFGGPALAEIARKYAQHGVYFDATLSIYGYWGPHDAEMTEYWTDELRFLTPHMRAIIESRPARPVLELFRDLFRVKLRTVEAFYRLGGRDLITLGTDHPSWGRYWSAFGAHRELLALQRAGIPPADVFRIATLNGARAMGLGDRLGSLTPGKLADLFVIRGDPLEDVRAARDVEYVMSRGVWYRTADLLTAAEGRIGPDGPADEPDWKPDGGDAGG